MDATERFREMLDASEKVVFFGGAGVSTESGIPDFRSVDGLYSQKYDLPPETIISHRYFISHPEEFFRFYKEKMIFPDAEPNACHLKLAELEKQGKLTAVVTQNIDGLHQKAGSSNVLELHGSVHRNYCMSCGKKYPLDFVLASDGIPRCECGGIVRPDVVLYEEALDPDVIERSVNAIKEADMLIIGGTSLVVYPAASLIDFYGGHRLVLINRGATGADGRADLVIRENIGKVFSQI